MHIVPSVDQNKKLSFVWLHRQQIQNDNVASLRFEFFLSIFYVQYSRVCYDIFAGGRANVGKSAYRYPPTVKITHIRLVVTVSQAETL